MKKLFFYINTIHRGGAERVIIKVAEGLANKGYDCTLITSFSDKVWEYPVSSSVKRINLEQDNSKDFIKKNVRRVWKLRDICKRETPDFLISFMAQPIMRSLFSTIGLPVKNIISIRNDPAKYWERFDQKVISNLFLKRAYWAVFQTNEAKQFYFGKRLYDHSQVIFNPTDSCFYDVEYNVDSKSVVACGRLAEQKNYKLMIKAFSRTEKQYPDWNLEIYGAGPELEELQKYIKELHCDGRVYLNGASDDVPSVLSKAGIFALSSDFEGMPNALMEALASGIPSVSTDCPCGGPKAIIEDGENGFLVPVKDDNAFADALIALMQNRELRIKVSNEAKARAQVFKEEEIINEWERMIESI